MELLSKLSTWLGASNPKRYILGALWIILTRILSLSVSLASTFYVARNLGPQNFGELSYAISTISILAFFGAIASSTVICRDLVRNSGKENTILGTAWILSAAGTLVTIILVLTLTILLPHNQLTIVVISILCLAQLVSPFQVAQNVFFAKAETKYISLAQLAIHIFVSVAKIIAMTQAQGVIVLATIMFCEQLLLASVIILLYKSHSKQTPLQWNWDSGYAKKLALDSLPFVIITMSSVVAGRIDQVFIKHFIDTTTVGFYNVAVQLTEIWQVMPLMFLAAIYPAIVNSHSTKESYKKRITLLSIVLVIYCLVASLFTSILAPVLVPLIYGDAFLGSIILVKVYSWSLIGTVCGVLVTNILITENLRKIQIVTGLVPMFLNVLLNLLWIPTHGAEGAAWATVISYSTAPIIPIGIMLLKPTRKRIAELDEEH